MTPSGPVIYHNILLGTMTGHLVDDTVTVKEQKEGSQLYNKGNYGYPRSGGGIDLDLVEATYLVDMLHFRHFQRSPPNPFK